MKTKKLDRNRFSNLFGGSEETDNIEVRECIFNILGEQLDW